MPFDLTPDDQSQPLTQRLPDSSFQQQGQLDWISLAGGSIRFSLNILSRLSAASIDPYTVTVGHFVGNCFELSREGRAHIQDALATLKYLGGLENVLWFGFGVRHAVRSIAVTEQGATLICLCASLAECFSEDFAAEILSAIVRQRANATISPAVSEWRALIRCMAGVLASTPFPIRAETLMRMQLRGDRQNLYEYASDPDQMAEALLAIGNISKGVWKSITIRGPREAGWIAAVAEWFFGLSVSITDEEGQLKHSSTAPGENPQVQIFYTVRTRGVSNSKALQLVERSYNLHTATELFKRAGPQWEPLDVLSTSGRVAWGNAFSATFGSSYERLMRMPTTVGDLLGSAGAIFEAIAKVRGDIPHKVLVLNRFYCDSAFGFGFVQNALHWFPELAPAKAAMFASCVSNDYEGARSLYETRIDKLTVACGCSLCGTSESVQSSGPLCLVVIVETIIVLSRLLAAVDIVDTLTPSLSGLQKAYNTQANKRLDAEDNHVSEPSEESSLGVLNFILDLAPRIEDIVLERALCLFSSRTLADLDERIDNPCAVSAGGICVYLGILREVTDNHQQLGRVQVIPGSVEHNDRPFSYIEGRHGWSSFSAQDLAQFYQKIENITPGSRVNVGVQETARSLVIQFNIMDEAGHDTGMIIKPYQLVANATFFRGLIPCCHGSRHNAGNAISNDLQNKMFSADLEWKLLAASTMGRCVAVGEVANNAVLREEECLECCVKWALRRDAKSLTVISKLHN